MPKMNNKEAFKALLMRELILDPVLVEEFNLQEVLEDDERDLSVSSVLSALDRGESVRDLGLEKSLKKVLKRKTLSAFSRDMAKKLESADKDTKAYEMYCQVAVCDGVARAPARAAKSLEEAASIQGGWARHHHLMGLIQGVRDNLDDAQQNLQTAMENEPFYNGKVRVRQALQYCEEAGATA